VTIFSILFSFTGCQKSDFSDEPPIPSLAYVDISGAKFFLCSKNSENEYDFTKISEQGIVTSVAFMDENQQPADISSMDFPRLIFSLDEYIGMVIYWNKSKDVGGNMSYAQTEIFYLIRKTDGKVLVAYDATARDEIAYGSKFSMDQYDNIYYKENYSLNKLQWSKSDPSVANIIKIDPDVDNYFLAPNGDLAYTKGIYTIKDYYFKFADGSTMEIPYQFSDPVKYYQAPAILELGLTNNGNFCANYKNANSYTCQFKILTKVDGNREFVFCNSANEEINNFSLLGDQLWGIDIQENGNLKFINFSECGSFIEYPNYLQKLYYFQHSQNFFYYYDNETKKVYRFNPGNGAPSVWKSFPDESDLSFVDYSLSKDGYSIFHALYSTPEPGGHTEYFFLDNNGNTIAELNGKEIDSYLVL
jgi:hypothetical protein